MVRGDFPSAKQDQFNLRFPDGMRHQLKEEAQNSGRSLNAEIIQRLAATLGRISYHEIADGLDVSSELEMQLTFAAERHNCSITEEVIRRLQQSFQDGHTLVSELEDQASEAKRKYEEILRLFIQLTPEERRLLEERAEVMDHARKVGFKSKDIGKFVKLHPIGNRGRIVLTQPKSDYSTLYPEENKT